LKISRNTIHPELRSVPLIGMAYSYLLTKRFGFKFLNSSFLKMEGKITKGLVNEKLTIKSRSSGNNIRLRVYKPDNNSNKLPIMLYLHGGGYAIGSPELSADLIKKFIETRPCIVVAPGYRNSQSKPYPAAFNDCYDTLIWIRDNAGVIKGDANKIIVAGHSAGGGLTAAITLKARDTKDVNISFQMPLYPMIDDRHQNESSQYESPIWGKKANYIGWELYLKELKDKHEQIPDYAAPARNKDYSDFPPSITFVGGIDPFRDETIEYVERLQEANIPVRFKLFDGCYHGFEVIDPKKQVSQEARSFLYNSYAEYYDTYIY